MTPVCVSLWECTKEEARQLPHGFSFVEYDTTNSSVRVITAGVEPIREDGRFVYLCYKLPPATFVGSKGGKSRLCAAAHG